MTAGGWVVGAFRQGAVIAGQGFFESAKLEESVSSAA
jgi:hypothetical protein